MTVVFDSSVEGAKLAHCDFKGAICNVSPLESSAERSM